MGWSLEGDVGVLMQVVAIQREMSLMLLLVPKVSR